MNYLIAVSLCLGSYFISKYTVNTVRDALVLRPPPKKIVPDGFLLQMNLRRARIDDIDIWITDNPQHKYWLLYSHQNAVDLPTLIPIIKYMSSYANVIFYDYPGYGESDGILSLSEVIKSSEIVINYIIEEIDVNKLVLYGYSLGGGPASHQAKYLAEHGLKPRALFLDSTFTSIYGMTPPVLQYPSYIFPDSLPVNSNLHYVNCPIYIRHSKKDQVIPFEHAVENSKVKECVFIEKSGDHNDFNEKNSTYITVMHKIFNT